MRRNVLFGFAMLAAVAPACLFAAESDITRALGVVDAVKTRLAPDKRQIIYDVKVEPASDGRVLIDGTISEGDVADSLVAALDAAGLPYINSVSVSPSDRWALPKIAVANMRTTPGHGAEMASQALMGMPLRLLEKQGDWWRVQSPDGYIAWVVDNSLAFKTDDEMKKWRSTPRMVVTSIYQTRAYASPASSGVRDVVTDLVNGDIVELASSKAEKGRLRIILPDGREGWVASADVTPIAEWAAQNFDAQRILDMAYSMEGQPYLWGGTSTKSLDCSGLAKVSYLSNGIILRRDASQQALTGRRIEARDWRDCRAGDLLFFGNAKTGRVTHVAIYDSNGDYVHSSGRVKRNSVDPSSPAYLTTPFLHAVRIDGCEGTDGITRARNHPWYFNL